MRWMCLSARQLEWYRGLNYLTRLLRYTQETGFFVSKNKVEKEFCTHDCRIFTHLFAPLF